VNDLGTSFSRCILSLAEGAIGLLCEEVVELLPPDASWLSELVILVRHEGAPSLIHLGIPVLALVEITFPVAFPVDLVYTVDSFLA